MTQEKEREKPLLSEMDLRIIRRVANGKSDAQIGGEIYRSKNTVKTHMQRIMRCVGAENRAHLAALALKYRLISPDDVIYAPVRTRLWGGTRRKETKR